MREEEFNSRSWYHDQNGVHPGGGKFTAKWFFFNKRPAKKSFFWKLITISKVKICIIWEKKNQKFHLDQRLWLIIPLEKRGLEMTKDLIRLQNWIYGNTLNWKLKSHSVGFPRKDETKLKKKYIIRKVQKFLRNMTLG